MFHTSDTSVSFYLTVCNITEAEGCFSLTWQASGLLLSSAVLLRPVLLFVSPGWCFWGWFKPSSSLKFICQWCSGKLKTPLIPFPSMSETRKSTENSISFSPVVSWGAPWWLDVNRLMLVNIPWMETLPLLVAVLWYLFSCAVKTVKATSCISEHVELLAPLWCVFWGRIFLSLWKCKRNCNTYGAKSIILLYALPTSNVSVWTLDCDLCWNSQCS